MQQQLNSPQCILLYNVRNQNNKPILHLIYFIMNCSKCVKYVFLQKKNTATFKLQNIYNVGCNLSVRY